MKQNTPSQNKSNLGKSNEQNRRQMGGEGSEHSDGKSRTTQGNDQQSQQRRATRDADKQ